MSESYAPETEDTETPEAQEPVWEFDLLSAVDDPNIAFDLDPGLLARMGAKVLEEFKIDEDSRVEWKARYDAAMKLALQTTEVKNTPWPNASNVKFPLISTAAIQFNARAYPAMIDGPEVVKGAVKGRPSPEKAARADRIGKHMSYQLLEEMDGWEEDTDRLLMQLPIVGCAFRKTYFDPLKGYNCSEMVSAADFVVNYWTKDLESCPRATHVLTFYPNEVQEKMRSGVWIETDLGRPQSAANDDDAPFTFYEQHRLWDLDEDGYAEPWIVTVEKETGKVVRVRARFVEGDIMRVGDGRIARITPDRAFTKYGFIPAPDGSFYDIGFGTLLNPLSETINSTINQLMDAGKLANLQGGFIGGGVSIKSGNTPVRPGEWKKVDTNGGMLRDNIVPLPVKEPSSVLFSLLGMLIDASKDVTSTQDILGGDAGKGTLPVGTVSALVEQGLKSFTAIVKRLHRALKAELAVLYRLNGRYLESETYFTFQDTEEYVTQEDYAEGDMDVVPVSDPNMATDMQRMQQAQFKMEVAGEAGGNMREAGKAALQAARVPTDEIAAIFPDEPPPPDPKALEAEAKAKAKDRELDIKEVATAADVAAKNAQTERTKLETMMMGPELAGMIEQVVMAAVQRTLALVENGGQPPVQPQELRGMGGPAPDAGVPLPPEGAAEQPGGPMGAGPVDGFGPADQGPPMGGAIDPQLA